MRLLVLSQLRFLRRAPWSAATALLGVSLGVASVVAVHLISARVERSLDESLPPHLAGLTHTLQRDGLSADDYFELRSWWRRHPQSRIRALVPLVEGNTLVGQRQAMVIGADWLAMPPAPQATPTITVSDAVLTGAEVLADAALGVAPGERLTAGGHEFVVAEQQDNGFGPTGIGPALFTDITAAQQILGHDPAALSRIGVAVVDPWERWRRWLNQLMPGFAAGLPQPPPPPLPGTPGDAQGDGGVAGGDAVRAWQVLPVAAERPDAALARSVLFNLGALGGLAMLVAWFLIYQVGVIWLRRQRVLLERLHALGVAPRVLRRSFLSLFLALGMLATIGGTLLGALLAPLLVDLSAQGVDVEAAGSPMAALDGWVAAKALLAGLGVCLLAGYAAFAREWQSATPSRRRRGLLVAGLVMVVLLGIGVDGSGVLGGFAAILAMSLLTAAAVSPLLSLLRRSAGRLGGNLTVRLALRDVVWYPRVLNVALAALTLAVATGLGIGVMVESFRLDFQRMLDVRLAGDLYVYDRGEDPAALAGWLQGQPDIRATARYGEIRTRVGGRPVEIGYAHFDAAESARYGHSGALLEGEALITERLARDLGVASGDRVASSQGWLRVAGIFPGFGEPMGRLLVDVSSLERLGVHPRFDRLTLHLEPGSDLADRLVSAFPDVRVESRSDLRALALRIFDRTFAITQALTLLALTVAVVATYNALTALRLQQASTSRLLEAQGMAAAQLRRIGVLRAGIMGGIAVALALPLGVAMAWVLCTVINPRSFGWTVTLSLPLAGWLPPLLLGMAAAVLTGALPAPRERGVLHDAG